MHGVKLLGGPASVDFDFCNELLMKRAAKTIVLMDSRIVTASGPGFGDWQWRLSTIPFVFGGLGVYSTWDVLNYAFLASRLQSADLQTKLLRRTDIVASGPNFDDVVCMFNTSMETDLLSNPSEIAAPKLIKIMADIYFTQVTKNAESTFSLSPRQMALWKSQREDHTSDWLRTVSIFGLGQTMNACSRVFVGDIYGDHAVSCVGIIGIKHRHNVVRDTLVDICYRSRISTSKEVDIGLDEGCDKPLRSADILLYSWDGGLDVCVDLTGSLPLTQTRMVDFVPGRAVIDDAQRKHEADAVALLNRIWKFFMTQDVGGRAAAHIFNRINFAIAKGVGAQIVSRLPSNFLYGCLPFSFSSFGELEKDAVTLLKKIRRFSVAQDIKARAVVHIFNRISFAIPRGVMPR
ncbi:hypothetical protein Tco_0317639 [Tanacetum coccineum]